MEKPKRYLLILIYSLFCINCTVNSQAIRIATNRDMININVLDSGMCSSSNKCSSGSIYYKIVAIDSLNNKINATIFCASSMSDKECVIKIQKD